MRLEKNEFSTPYICKCTFIDEISQLNALEELVWVSDDEIIGITVQMNADAMNEEQSIDVFGPALLTLGTSTKVFIIDILKLGKY